MHGHMDVKEKKYQEFVTRVTGVLKLMIHFFFF